MTIAERPDTEAPPLQALDAGVIEEARARQRRHRAAGAAAILVAAIAALLGLSLGGGGGSAHPLSARAGRQRSPAAAGRPLLASCSRAGSPFVSGSPSRALLGILGVLRRPATAADALPATTRRGISTTASYSGVEVFARFIRRARVVAGVPYYVWPVAHRACGATPTLAGQQGMDIGFAHGWGGAGDAATIADGTSLGAGTATFGKSTLMGLVPDGVATVTLRYPAGKIGGFDRHHAPAFALTTRIVGNVLVATIPRGGMRLMAPATMIWRAADGTVVRTFHRL